MAEWRDVLGYEGAYKVSDRGRVRGPRKILRPATNRSGYKVVSLCLNGIQRTVFVHKLVAVRRESWAHVS